MSTMATLICGLAAQGRRIDDGAPAAANEEDGRFGHVGEVVLEMLVGGDIFEVCASPGQIFSHL